MYVMEALPIEYQQDAQLWYGASTAVAIHTQQRTQRFWADSATHEITENLLRDTSATSILKTLRHPARSIRQSINAWSLPVLHSCGPDATTPLNAASIPPSPPKTIFVHTACYPNSKQQLGNHTQPLRFPQQKIVHTACYPNSIQQLGDHAQPLRLQYLETMLLMYT